MASKRSGKSRRADQLRPLRFVRKFTDSPAGAVLVHAGSTKVLCTASFVNELPQWRRESQLGWVTAEYSMLPGATCPRRARSRIGHTDGRGTEIQRLIGRAMRSVVDFEKLGPNTIYLDCDVLQADGGTRTAAINGSYVALVDAIAAATQQGLLTEDPLTCAVAAVSVGIVRGRVVLDLDYELDSQAEVDMNVVMLADGRFVEVQGAAERAAFTDEQLAHMLQLAGRGIRKVLTLQKQALRM